MAFQFCTNDFYLYAQTGPADPDQTQVTNESESKPSDSTGEAAEETPPSDTGTPEPSAPVEEQPAAPVEEQPAPPVEEQPEVASILKVEFVDTNNASVKETVEQALTSKYVGKTINLDELGIDINVEGYTLTEVKDKNDNTQVYTTETKDFVLTGNVTELQFVYTQNIQTDQPEDSQEPSTPQGGQEDQNSEEESDTDKSRPTIRAMLLANPDQMVDVTVKYDDKTETRQIQVGKIAEKAQAITIEAYTFDNAKVGNTLVDTIAYDSTTDSYYVTTSDNQLTGIKLVDTTKVVLTYKKIVESYNIAYDLYVDGEIITEVSNVIDIVGASTVDEGDNLEFSFNLKKGYELDNVQVEDNTLSPNANDVYTIEDVKENQTVKIYLNKIKTYDFVFKESSNTVLIYKGEKHKSEKGASEEYGAFSNSIYFELEAYNQHDIRNGAALNKLLLTIDGVQYGVDTPTSPSMQGDITTDLGNGISVTLKYLGTTDLGWRGKAPKYRVTISTTDSNGLHGDITVITNYKDADSSEVWIKQADGLVDNKVLFEKKYFELWLDGEEYSPSKYGFLTRDTGRDTRVSFNVAPGYSTDVNDISITVLYDGNSKTYTAQKLNNGAYYFIIPKDSRGFTPKDIRIMISVKSLDKTYTANYEYGNEQPDKTVGEYSEGNNFLVSDEETEYPKKDGYVFVGWQLGDTVYKPGSLFSITEDTNDFAVFDSQTGKYVFNFVAVWEDADTAERVLYKINVYFEDKDGGYLKSPTLSLDEYGPNGEITFIIQGELNDKLSTQSGLPENWQENYELDHGKNGNYSVEIKPNGESFINIYYKLKDYSFVTKHVYVNEEGEEIRDTISHSIKAGQTIETEPKQRNGYTLSDAKVTPSNAGVFAGDNTFSGVMPKEEVTVTYTYKSIVEKDIGGPIISVTGKDNDERYKQGTVTVNVYVDGVINKENSGSVEYGYWQYAAVDLTLEVLNKNYVLNAIDATQVIASTDPEDISNTLIDNVQDESTVNIYLSSVYTVNYEWADESLDGVIIQQDENKYTIPKYSDEVDYTNGELTNYKDVLEINSLPTKDGYVFSGWYNEINEITKPKSSINSYEGLKQLDENGDFVINLNTSFDARTDLGYEIHYFYDGEEDTDNCVTDGKGTLGERIPYDTTLTEYNGKNYVLDRVDGKDKTISADPAQNVVNVYYTLDEIGTEDPDEPDEVADKYQVTVTFEAVNGTVDKTKAVVTLFDEEGQPAEKGTGYLKQDQIATATAEAGYNQGTLTWTPETPTTAYGIKDDMTFTASFTRDFDLITVTPYEGEYDGQEHNVTVNGTIKGDKVEYSLDGGQTYELGIAFGVADVTLKNDGVYNVTVRVTNGGISHEYESTIKITPRPITITTGSATKTYDGTPLTNSEIEITKGSLVNKSDLEYRTNGTITNAGTAENSILTIGTIEMHTNYDITVEEGTLTVTPRPITLTSGSASKNYDGTALTNSEVTITSGSLVNTSDVTYAAVGSITNVGSSLNRISVSYASEQMARNYAVTLVEGTLTVNTAPTTPTTPTTPPTTPGTPGTTTDDGATTDEPEVEEVEDEETPLSDGDVEDVEDNATPKGNNGIWALINLIAAIVTVILGLILLLSKRHRNDEEEDEEERQARIERGEEKEQEQKRGWICKVLGVIVAIVSVVFFILTEDMSLPMALTDKWTIWMIVIAIVELVLVLVGRHWKDVDDEDQEQQA